MKVDERAFPNPASLGPMAAACSERRAESAETTGHENRDRGGDRMAMQPYVHVETLEEYSERFKDFAYLERADDGILLCRLHW